MAKLILTTVGTSLLDEKDKQLITPQTQLDSLIALFKNVNRTVDDLIRANGPASCFKAIALRSIDKLWNLPNIWSGNNPNVKKFPAEIASLKSMELDKDTDKVLLIYSGTKPGAFCARCLQEFINGRIAICGVNDLVRIDGLVADNYQQFKGVGLKNLIDRLIELIQRYKASYDVHINATGGFKPEGIYATFTGAFLKVPVYYQYEDFTHNIDLPRLPANLDISLWREYEEMILSALEIGGKTFDDCFNRFTNDAPEMTALFNQPERTLSPLGELFQEVYALKRTDLGLERSHASMSQWIKDEQLKKRYLKHVGFWVKSKVLWEGEKTPEMIEHHRGHRQNLLDLARQMLVPIFELDEDFLSPEEVYVLLSAIWLHDIGHIGGKIYCPNFEEERFITEPFLVRVLHQNLTYERLKTYAAAHGFDNEFDGEVEAIAQVCKYHSRKTPINPEDALKVIDAYTGVAIQEAIPETLPFKDKNIRSRLLAALLSLIDGCDVRIERAGEKEYVTTRKKLIAEQLDAEIAKINDFRCSVTYQLAKCCLTSDTKSFLEEYLKKESVEKGYKPDTDEGKKLMEVFDLLRKSENQDELQLFRLLEEYHFIKNRILFKLAQSSHYDKHGQIKDIRIEKADGFSKDCYKFRIVVYGMDGADTTEVIKDIKGKNGEYERVKGILAKAHIHIVEVQVR